MIMDIQTILTRGVAEVIEKKHLEQALKSGKKLRVKLGIDPTSPNIHIGRAVLLLKLRAFQEAGHTAIFIIGDSTGIVGDTSDKESERPMLTEKQIKANMKTYLAQAYTILDKKKTEVYYNSKWLNKLGFLELARMANLFGLHEMESREIIARRLSAGQRVSIHEILYPLMQGYDSVAVKADLELGGTDQRFNLLAGRRIQPMYDQTPQDILMMELLEGTDGRKMSSSWGNVINVTDEPAEIFGRVMSISDELIIRYFILCTEVPESEIASMAMALKNKSVNPRNLKSKLAFEIVKLYHGEKPAKTAHEGFESKFGTRQGEVSADFEIKKTAGSYSIVDILVEGKLASSKSEARRKLREGAVEIDGSKITDETASVKLTKGTLIRLGKRFLRIK